MIYKILSKTEWHHAEAAGQFNGSAIDLQDGYIHFSTREQVRETAARHFAGQGELMLLAVDEKEIDKQLKWEPSRGGALFPHLYAHLPVTAVKKAWPLPWTGTSHKFPEEI